MELYAAPDTDAHTWTWWDQNKLCVFDLETLVLERLQHLHNCAVAKPNEDILGYTGKVIMISYDSKANRTMSSWLSLDP